MGKRQDAGRRGYPKAKAAFDAFREARTARARAAHAVNNPRCPECGTQITYERRAAKFCNRSCAAKFNNSKSPKRRRNRKPCACGGTTRLKNKWCDECIALGKHTGRKELGDITHDSTIRAYLLRSRPLLCEVCSRSEWEGVPIPLQADHIDGNSDHNSEENLRLICPNCHALTPTYAGRNRGNGRGRQRKATARYHAGLKY